MFRIIYTTAKWILNNRNAATRGVRQRLTSKEILIEESSRYKIILQFPKVYIKKTPR